MWFFHLPSLFATHISGDIISVHHRRGPFSSAVADPPCPRLDLASASNRTKTKNMDLWQIQLDRTHSHAFLVFAVHKIISIDPLLGRDLFLHTFHRVIFLPVLFRLSYFWCWTVRVCVCVCVILLTFIGLFLTFDFETISTLCACVCICFFDCL